MCEGGHEGVIAKRADSRYIGDRTTNWLKIKCTKRQEFVVVGYRPSNTGRGMASLILGTYEKGRLVYCGRVGTGFTQAMSNKILAQLEKRRLDKPEFASVPRDISRVVGVTLTDPDKVMYPGTEVTQGMLAAYYAVVVEKTLPHIQDRPLSLVRDIDGDLAKTFSEAQAAGNAQGDS